MTQTYPVVGFAPDAAPDTPGIFIDSAYVLPTERGIGQGFNVTRIATSIQTEHGDLSACMGGAALPKLSDGTNRYFFGTANALYELNAVGFTTTVRSSGTTAISSPELWTFGQFGDISLAVSKSNPLLKLSSTDTTFSTVSGAPGADMMVVCGEPNASFVMLFGYKTVADGYVADGVYWSALGNYADWTPSIATESGNIRLLDVNGPFTAALPYRDGVIAWKDHSMHVGSYVGGAGVWAWTTISKDIGCMGRYACCVADDVVYFASASGIWMFDGSYPRRVPGQVQRYWREKMAASPGTIPQVRWRKASRHLLVGAGGPLAATDIPSWLAYNTESGIWTLYGNLSGNDSVSLILDDGMVAVSSTCTVDSLVTDNFAGTSTFTTNGFGNPFGMTTLRGIRPVFASGPSDTPSSWVTATVHAGPTLRNLYTSTLALPVTFAQNFVEPTLDGVLSGRYVGAVVQVTYPKWEITSIAYDLFPDGSA